jgi:hypothetical protein
MLDDVPAHSDKVGGWLCESIAVLIDEGQQLCLFLWAHLGAKENNSIRHSGV